MSSGKQKALITLAVCTFVVATSLFTFAGIRQNTATVINSITEFLGLSAPDQAAKSAFPPPSKPETAEAEPMFFAGELLQWNTFGNAGTETTEPSVFNDPNVSSANLTFGSVTAAANGNRFGGSNWFDTGDTNPTTLAESITGNDYIQFIVTPNSGYRFTPTSFVFSWDHSAAGPANLALRSSVDGYASNLGAVTGLAASITTGNTITISGLTNLTTATTFRLYGYGATATGGTGGFDTSTSVVNVQLNGTTSAIPPTITSVSPTSGSTSGGFTLTVNGTNLTGASAVTVGGNACPILSNLGTVITCTAPAHPAGLVDVSVTTPGGTSANTAADDFTYASPPTIGVFANTSVGLSGNTTITPDLGPTGATSISVIAPPAFNGTLSADTATGVVRVMDAHPAGTYPLTVTAFGLGGTVSTTFNLTVTDGTSCGGATSFSFQPAATVAIGTGTFPRGLAVGDLNHDGNQDVVTANGASNNISVLLGNGSGGFGAAANYSMGSSPINVALGDMNGDGWLDAITPNTGSNNVSYRPGGAGGTFGALTNFTVGSQPTWAVIGDFNGDGRLDFAVTNSGSNNVSIRLGDGAGGFAAATNFAVGTTPVTVATGEFNGDGKLDLTTANFSSNNVSVLLGNGVGGFAAAVNFTAGTSPISVAAGDLNGDGNQDLAVANQGFLPGVGVLMGDGAGSFGPRSGYPGGILPAAVAFGDFNNDGKQDLAAGDQNGPTVPILLGNGAGGFEYTRNFTVGTSPRSIAVADLNGDGRQDIIAGNSGSNNLSVLLGTCITPEADLKGNGVSIADGDVVPSLADHTDFGSTPILSRITRTFTIENTGTGDLYLTQANQISIIGANPDDFQLTVLPASHVVGAGSSVTFNVDFYPGTPGLKTAVISIGNSDRDENPYDFAIQGMATASYTVTYDGNGNTGGTAPIDPNSPYTYPATVTVLGNSGTLVKTNYTFSGWNTQSDGLGTTYQPADTFSIEGFTTLYAIWTPTPATLGSYADTSIVMSDNGMITPGSAPTFTTSISAHTNTRFKGTLAADPTTGAVTVTNAYPSGIYPITVTAFGLGGPVSTSFNLTVNAAGCGGTSGLGPAANLPTGTAPILVAVGDFNGDGNQDLVTANSGSASVSVLIGSVSGTFGAPTNFAVGTTPQSLAVGDFNGDGRQDIVVGNYGSSSVSLLLGNGSGSFAPKTDTSLAGQSPYAIALADINGDGRQDVVTANVNRNVSILFGSGSGTFAVSLHTVGGDVPVSIAAGDFNNDGNQDLVVAHSFAGYVTIMPGNGDGTFGIFTTFTSGPYSASVAVGDLNGDGNQDLAVANSSEGTISVLAGNGLGGFATAVPFSVGNSPLHVATADLNGDGNLDLLSANYASNDMSVLIGNGSGSFAPAVNYAVGTAPYAVAVGDVNGDGFQDIVASNSSTNNLSVRLGTCMTSVTYNGNGSDSGSAPVDPVSYPVGSTVTLLNNTGGLTRNGYDFNGWNTAADGSGTSYAPGSTFTISANTTLYAQWAIRQYTLTYNAGMGGTISGITPQTVNHGSNGTAVTAVPNSGFAFVNWSDLSTANPRTDTNVTGPITVTANFVPNQYSLTVNAGAGGSITQPGTSPSTVDHGSPTPIIAVANVGYTFTNWTVTAGSASIANPNSAATTVTLTSGNASIQANFAPLTTVQLGSAGSFIGVEGSTAAVTVTRSGVTTGTSTVQYSLSGGTATAGTCGVGNADYVAVAGTLTFDPSETTKTISVTLCGDAFAESPDETIGVTISSPTGAVLGTPDDGDVRIIDTDASYLNTGEFDTTAGGTATTYPEPITVSGFTGNISGLTVSLFAMTQNVPDDIDILLVSPDGTRKMVIMSYAGGSQPLSDVSFRFADTAGGFVPDPGPITDGAVYKPTNCVANVPDFPAPAPAGPYSEPGCSGSPAATFASVFGGMGPNGVWKLYVRDHSSPLSPLAGNGHHYGWGIHFVPFVPTAGEVAVAGRITTADGAGIRNARVTVSGGDLAQPLTALTGAFGHYRVDGLTAGETYVVTVASKNYSFGVPSRIVTLGDSATDIDFIANPLP